MPDAEQVRVVELLSSTVFAVSPESVMVTFDGGAASQVANNAASYCNKLNLTLN